MDWIATVIVNLKARVTGCKTLVNATLNQYTEHVQEKSMYLRYNIRQTINLWQKNLPDEEQMCRTDILLSILYI